MARIVVLNGVSSAGKSALAAKMQELSTEDWLHVSMDTFISMVPIGRETAAEWFVVEDKTTERQSPLVSITNGPLGAKLLTAMRCFVAAAADQGLDMIVDEVCTASEIEDYRARLTGHDLRIVKVAVDPLMAQRREKSRGDRRIGIAREQEARIHEGIAYDCEIENRDGALEENARFFEEQIRAR